MTKQVTAGAGSQSCEAPDDRSAAQRTAAAAEDPQAGEGSVLPGAPAEPGEPGEPADESAVVAADDMTSPECQGDEPGGDDGRFVPL